MRTIEKIEGAKTPITLITGRGRVIAVEGEGLAADDITILDLDTTPSKFLTNAKRLSDDEQAKHEEFQRWLFAEEVKSSSRLPVIVLCRAAEVVEISVAPGYQLIATRNDDMHIVLTSITYGPEVE